MRTAKQENKITTSSQFFENRLYFDLNRHLHNGKSTFFKDNHLWSWCFLSLANLIKIVIFLYLNVMLISPLTNVQIFFKKSVKSDCYISKLLWHFPVHNFNYLLILFSNILFLVSDMKTALNANAYVTC